MGVRKALAHLFPAGNTKERGVRWDPGSAINASNLPTRTKSDFWSDFDRRRGESCRDSGRSAHEESKPLSILVPFDFTTTSCAALDCALRMAQKGKARITLLHAIHINISPYGPANLALIKQDLRQEAGTKISKVAALAKQQNVSADYVIQEGKPSSVIENFVKEQPVDLVILGCHRHRGLGWFGRRRTAEKVVRKAQCPVLVLQTGDFERTLL